MLLDFIVHLVKYFKRTEGTVKAKLFGVRYFHLMAGLEDPLLHKGRVWLALGGVKRLGPSARRKFPVTVEMLRWLKQRLEAPGPDGRDDPDQAVEWAAIIVGFMFLLRAGEYLAVTGAPWQAARALCGGDVQARREGRPIEAFAQADEVLVHIRGSKTDQYNQGMLRNQFSTGTDLDHVAALARLQRHFPERWQAERDQPLFRLRNGRHLRRERVQQLLGLAGAAAGLCPSQLGTHSLRIGGATALYKAGFDVECIKRMGRWASNAVHNYLWETHEKQRGLAARMVEETGTLTSVQAFGREDQRDGEEQKRRRLDRVEARVRWASAS